MNPYLSTLLAEGKRADRLTAQRVLPARGGRHGEWPGWVQPQVIGAYRALGVSEPWVHQTQAANAIWAGQHAALATGTGSGKSLAFWLPALHYVAAGGTVLYLSPTKALAADQFHSLRKLLDGLTKADLKMASGNDNNINSGFRNIQAATCDGDTPSIERGFIQEHAQIVLSNPDFVHFSMLPGHRRWARFLKRLRLVIIDEGHTYRGVFGAHVAQVLRRLTRLTQHYQAGRLADNSPAGRRAANSQPGTTPSWPVFVVASATSAAPAQSAGRLIGVAESEIATITADGSPVGKKTVALWQPPETPALIGPPMPNPALVSEPGAASTASGSDAVGFGGFDGFLVDPWTLPDPFDPAATDPMPIVAPTEHEPPPPRPQRRTATAEAAELLAELVTTNARTLTFTRSRRGAETVATTTRERLRTQANKRRRRPAGKKTNAAATNTQDTDLAAKVAAYRGGYLPEERRELERQIRTGEVLGLATTNALELGVDISGLDAVLIAGWPGTLMSWWQQAGRAGRAGADGLVVFVARDEPLDQYLVTHPEAVFDKPLEATVFDPHNKFVLAGHLCAAAAEHHISSGELSRFGEQTRVLAVLNQLTEAGVLRRRPTGWYWTHDKPAAALVDLRSAGGAPIRVVDARSGQLLGTVDAGAADAQVHTGAVYVHQGQTFVVKELDLTDRVALVAPQRVDYGTWARELMSLSIVPGADDGIRTKAAGRINWGFGPVEVSSQVVSFERRRLPDLITLGTEPLELPVRTLDTMAVWWTVGADVIEKAGILPDELPGALHAAEHASIALLPLFATCDRWDLGGLSTDHHADTGEATIFVYDAYPGGAGFAERAYELANEWLSATRDLIANCACEAGCPACIQSPKCGNYNHPLNKQAALKLLELVVSVL